MLIVVIEGDEFYNEEEAVFETVGDVVLKLEHSLVSLSKWESKFQKPFLSADDKNDEEILFYIECMIQNTEELSWKDLKLKQTHIDKINEYINSSESATTFGMMPETRGRGETITSELIYYWLVAYNIPFQVETWNLNRLFSLIKICNIKNSKPTKMSRSAINERNKALNAERKAKFGTTG